MDGRSELKQAFECELRHLLAEAEEDHSLFGRLRGLFSGKKNAAELPELPDADALPKALSAVPGLLSAGDAAFQKLALRARLDSVQRSGCG